MNMLLALVVLVLAARIGGEIATRARQSPMLGEIVAGLLLGPTALNLITPNETLEFLGHLGILFMTFLAGMETDLRMLRKVAGPSVLVSILGIVFSVGLGAPPRCQRPVSQEDQQPVYGGNRIETRHLDSFFDRVFGRRPICQRS